MYVRDSITKLPLIGENRKDKYKKLGIETVEDLLRFQPRGYLDLRRPTQIDSIGRYRIGEKVAVLAKIEHLSFGRTARKGVLIVTAKLNDGSGVINAVWFNQQYLRSFLKESSEFLFFGTTQYDFSSKKIVLQSPRILPKPDIYLVYPQTAGLTSRQISQSVKTAIKMGYTVEEFLPPEVIKEFKVLLMDDAIKKMHFPTGDSDLELSRERFDFEDIFVFICQNIIQNNQKETKIAHKIRSKKDEVLKVISSLPFKLTSDQEESVFDILDDFTKKHPMNRLLQGDVGSGKTIVSLIASLFVMRAGYQVIYLAPTELLAIQHHQTASNFLKQYGFGASLVTGTSKHGDIKADMVIGTHAVLNRNLEFDKIGLVIIDEQHRFGVEQRSELIEKSCAHLLSLSATPIPRTIGHLLFGNLAISQIKTKPYGRKKIKTYLIPKEKKSDTYQFIKNIIKKGEQVFIVCPLIEKQTGGDSLFELDELKSVTRELDELKLSCLADTRIAGLHGRMKSDEKEKIMNDFRLGKTDVLVSTSVIEVGVDVPGATVMMVEGAERFGLSQLHQFRGRVGRNNLQSYCFLFSDNLNDNTRERLKAFVRIDDGFELSKIDLRLRGAGELFGLEQSGFSGFNPKWLENEDRLKEIFESAKKVIEKVGKYPALQNKLEEGLKTLHLE